MGRFWGFLFLLVPLLFNSFKGKDLLPGVVHGAMKTSNSDLGALANIYLPLLLDLSVETLDWKKDTIMLYAADSDSSDRFNEYFLNAEKRVKFIKISV